MAQKRPDYLAYLLRLWRVNADETPADETPRGQDEKALWRASLEHARTRELTAFASLDELFEFLRRETGVSLAAGKDESTTSE